MATVADRLSWRDRITAFIEHPLFQRTIIGLIILNAVILGLQTYPAMEAVVGEQMVFLNGLIVAVFVIEILLRLASAGPKFFRGGWNLFDFAVVAISLVPDSAGLSVLRALRILRVMRLLSTVGQLRIVTESLLRAVPGIGWIGLLLMLVFYVFGVMATELFGASFPERFGDLGASMYSLFQIMTLESWSEAMGRPVMEVHPYAWIFFITFILMSSFTVLNLFIGVIVNSMQALHWTEEEAVQAERDEKARVERERMLHLIEDLHKKVDQLEKRKP